MKIQIKEGLSHIIELIKKTSSKHTQLHRRLLQLCKSQIKS